MKKNLLLFLLIPFYCICQNHQYTPYTILENFPVFENRLMMFNVPAPIQFNRTNVFAPKIDLNCKPMAYIKSYNNCAYDNSFGPGQGVDSPIGDTIEALTYFNDNNWVTNTSTHALLSLLSISYNFNDLGSLESYVFSSDIGYSSNFSYDENNLIESYQNNGYLGPLSQFNSYQFEWSNNNQNCEVIKNNDVIASFQADSIGNTLFEFDSLGKLIKYSNISDYSNLNESGPQPNNGYIRIDTINFLYDNTEKISKAIVKKYYHYITEGSTQDSLVIHNINSWELIIDYLWENQHQVELKFNTGVNSDEMNLLNITSTPCLNHDSISKYLFYVDSNQYITNSEFLDVNLNPLVSSNYLFCDDDTIMVFGCQDISACNYDSAANFSLTFFMNPGGPCDYAQEYYDCDEDCLNDLDFDGICDEIEVLGCIDNTACNYNSEATDSADCSYPEMYYDCEGNCINDIDNDQECDEVDYDDGIGIDELEEDTPKLIKMIDILGREHKEHKRGLIMFYVFDNGSVKKRILQ